MDVTQSYHFNYPFLNRLEKAVELFQVNVFRTCSIAHNSTTRIRENVWSSSSQSGEPIKDQRSVDAVPHYRRMNPFNVCFQYTEETIGNFFKYFQINFVWQKEIWISWRLSEALFQYSLHCYLWLSISYEKRKRIRRFARWSMPLKNWIENFSSFQIFPPK